MSGADASIAQVARMLNDNVERVLELCARGSPPGESSVVARILHLLLDRYGPDDPATFYEGLSSTQHPLSELLAGLDMLEHGASALLAEQTRPRELVPLSRALERMIDEIRGQYVRNTRRLQSRAQETEIELARFLEARATELLELCRRDGHTACRQELFSQILGLLTSRYLGADEADFWSKLVNATQQPMAAILDGLDRIGHAGVRLIMRRADPENRARMFGSLERMIDDVRGEYLHVLRLGQRGPGAEFPALEHLPGPLFMLAADYALEPINSAARRYLSAAEGTCYAAFFARDSPCAGCPLPRVLQHWEHHSCPTEPRRSDLSEVVGLSPYSVTHAMVHLASPSQAVKERAVPGGVDREVLENIAGGVIFADEQGYVVYANGAATELVGDRIEGLALKDLLPGISLRSDDRQHQLWRNRSDGNELLLGYRCVPCVLDGLTGTLISLRDITETERMRSDMEKLRRLSEVGRMCAVIAHEIRNPLAGIRATLDSIDEQGRLAGLDGPMSIIRQEVDRLGELLSSFFAFVRHRPPRRAQLDIEEPITRALRAAAPYLDGRHLRTHHDVQGPVWVDGHQLEQLLLNLLINAAQATPPGADISLDARLNATGDWLRIRVIDTGCGMPADVQDKIFDAFYTTKPGGTGLGLSICYRIATDHGGRIKVESAAGEGTCMTVELPARPPA